MKKTALLILVYLYQYFSVFSQTAPKYSNEFLNIGVGARALGMANAQVSLVNDATSGYWNPAGLLHSKKRYEVALMHSEHFGGIAKYDFAAFTTPIDSMSHLGISVIRFAIDDIPDTRFLYDANGNINYDNIRFFNSADYAFLLSYARKMSFLPGLKVGANLKIIYRNAGNFANAFGFGLDAGAQWSKNQWHLGLMARDITSTFNAWTHNSSLIYDIYTQTGNVIPKNTIELTLPRVVLGVGREFNFSEKIGLLAALDWNFTFDGARNVLVKSSTVSIDPSLGLEFNYLKLIYLRTGFNNYQQIKNFDGSTFGRMQANFGLGLKLRNLSIDYALSRNNTDVQAGVFYSNIFSVLINFDKIKN
jgi:hypothetical protein